MTITPPVNGSASQEISGSNRAEPFNLCWNAGFKNTSLGPPPEPKSKKPNSAGGSYTNPPPTIGVTLVPQPLCHSMVLLDLSARLIPPTPVAYGESAGALTLGGKYIGSSSVSSPLSPVEKLAGIPWTAAISLMRF